MIVRKHMVRLEPGWNLGYEGVPLNSLGAVHPETWQFCNVGNKLFEQCFHHMGHMSLASH